jgi:hypothetical protein
MSFLTSLVRCWALLAIILLINPSIAQTTTAAANTKTDYISQIVVYDYYTAIHAQSGTWNTTMCQNSNLVMLRSGDPSYEHKLSAVLAAFAANMPIRMFVGDSSLCQTHNGVSYPRVRSLQVIKP